MEPKGKTSYAIFQRDTIIILHFYQSRKFIFQSSASPSTSRKLKHADLTKEC